MLLEIQRKQYEYKLKALEELKDIKGKSACIFKLREKILGVKKTSQESVAMIDPTNGDMLVTEKEINKASIDHLANLLSNRDPKPAFTEEYNYQISLHEERMHEEDTNEDSGFSDEYFNNLMKHLQRKDENKYKFLLMGGSNLKCATSTLIQRVWIQEKKPDLWKDTKVYQG